MEISLSQKEIADNSNNIDNLVKQNRKSPLKLRPSKVLQNEEANHFLQVLQKDSLSQNQKNKSFQSSTKTPQSSIGAKDSLISHSIASREISNETGTQSYPLIEDICFQNQGEFINYSPEQHIQQQKSHSFLMEQDKNEENSDNEEDSNDSLIHYVWQNGDDDLIVRGIDIKNWKDKQDNQFNIFNLYKARSGQFLTHRENIANYIVCKNIERLYNSYSKERQISQNVIQSLPKIVPPVQTSQPSENISEIHVKQDQGNIHTDKFGINVQQNKPENSLNVQQSKMMTGKLIKTENSQVMYNNSQNKTEKQQIMVQKQQIIAEKYQIISDKTLKIQNEGDSNYKEQIKRKRNKMTLSFKEYLMMNPFKDTNDYTQSGFSHILFDNFKEYYLKYKQVQEKKYNFCPYRFKRDLTNSLNFLPQNLDENSNSQSPKKYARHSIKKFTVDVFKSPENKPIQVNQPEKKKSFKLNQNNIPQKFHSANDLSLKEDVQMNDNDKILKKTIKPLNFKTHQIKNVPPLQQAAAQENQDKINKISQEYHNNKNQINQQIDENKNVSQKQQTMTSLNKQNKYFDDLPLSTLKGKLETMQRIVQNQKNKNIPDKLNNQATSQKNYDYEQILAPLKEELQYSKIHQLPFQNLPNQTQSPFNQRFNSSSKRIMSSDDISDDFSPIKQNESTTDFVSATINSNTIRELYSNEAFQNNNSSMNCIKQEKLNISPKRKSINQQKFINSQTSSSIKVDEFKKQNQEMVQKNKQQLINNQDSITNEQNQSIILKIFHNKSNSEQKLQTKQFSPTKLQLPTQQEQFNTYYESFLKKQSQNISDKQNLNQDSFHPNISNDISPIANIQYHSNNLNDQSPIYFLSKNKNRFNNQNQLVSQNQINNQSQENSQRQVGLNRLNTLNKFQNQSSIINKTQQNISQINNASQLNISQLQNESEINNSSQNDIKNNRIYNQNNYNELNQQNINQSQLNNQFQLNNQTKIKNQTQLNSQSNLKNKNFQNNSNQRLFQRLYNGQQQTDESSQKIDEYQNQNPLSHQKSMSNQNHIQQDSNISIGSLNQQINQYYIPLRNEQNKHRHDRFKSVLSFENMANSIKETNMSIKKQSIPSQQQLQQSIENLKKDKNYNMLNNSQSSLGQNIVNKKQETIQQQALQISTNTLDKYKIQPDKQQNNEIKQNTNLSQQDIYQGDSPIKSKQNRLDNQLNNMIYKRSSILNNSVSTSNQNNVKKQLNTSQDNNAIINSSNNQFNSMSISNQNIGSTFTNNMNNVTLYKQNNVSLNGVTNTSNQSDLNNFIQEKKNFNFTYSKNNLKEFLPLKNELS